MFLTPFCTHDEPDRRPPTHTSCLQVHVPGGSGQHLTPIGFPGSSPPNFRVLRVGKQCPSLAEIPDPGHQCNGSRKSSNATKLARRVRPWQLSHKVSGVRSRYHSLTDTGPTKRFLHSRKTMKGATATLRISKRRTEEKQMDPARETIQMSRLWSKGDKYTHGYK